MRSPYSARFSARGALFVLSGSASAIVAFFLLQPHITSAGAGAISLRYESMRFFGMPSMRTPCRSQRHAAQAYAQAKPPARKNAAAMRRQHAAPRHRFSSFLFLFFSKPHAPKDRYLRDKKIGVGEIDSLSIFDAVRKNAYLHLPRVRHSLKDG